MLLKDFPPVNLEIILSKVPEKVNKRRLVIKNEKYLLFSIKNEGTIFWIKTKIISRDNSVFVGKSIKYSINLLSTL